MTIRVTEALCSDTSEKAFRERESGGDYVDGLWVEGTTKTIRALASFQQPTANQIKTLKEGERTSDPRLIICNKELRTTNDADGTVADIVIRKKTGERYKIIALQDWSAYGQSTAMGVRVS